MHQPGKPAQCLVIKAERFANFARRRSATISDDVCRHRRAEFSVALVNILNRALALIAARQIEIDVRPLAALFRKKAFKQQLHADRIDGSDAQGIADGAVCRRAAPLNQNSLLVTKLNDVPNDQEITFEFELFDQLELALNLRSRRFISGLAVAAGITQRAPSSVRCRKNDVIVSPVGTGYLGNS